MLVPFDNFCGGSAQDVIKGINDQQCVNLYPAVTTGGKSPVVLRKCPGQELYFANTDGATIIGDGGIYTSSLGDLYIFYSHQIVKRLYKNGGSVDFSFATTYALADFKRMAISDNGITVFTVNEDLDGYTSTSISANNSIQPNDPVWVGSTHVAYLDGYFIINDAGTNILRVSPVDWNGVTAWNSLAFETDDQTPGAIQGLIVCGSDLWTFRTGGFSIYYNAGTTPFPFARNQSASGSIGLRAPYSLATINNRVFWLGSGKDGAGKVFMSEGFNPVKISTPELDSLIASYINATDALGFTWQENGHTFYALTFKTANVTWVLDISAGAWHQRSSKLSAANVSATTPIVRVSYSQILSDGTYGRWNACGIQEFNGEIYVRDFPTGNVNKLKPGTYTDDSQPIIWRRTAPLLSASLKRMFFNYLQIDMDTGTGLLPDSVQGYDPIIFLRYSDDGGKSWSTPKQGNIGKIGTYNTSVKWNRLGSSKNRLFEISGADPVSTTVYQAFLDMEAENG